MRSVAHQGQFALCGEEVKRQVQPGDGVQSADDATDAHRDLVRRLGAARDALWIPETGDTRAETNRRAIWDAVSQPGEKAAAATGTFPLMNRAFRIVERLWKMRDAKMNEDGVATKLALHEAVCAERWKQANDRLGRIKIVLAAIVLLLLVGEGNVIAVLRRILGG